MSLAPVTVQSKKAWTLLIYVAGDNDLDPYARLDLDEMLSLPSDEHVYVIVQFDARDRKTYRYRFTPGRRNRLGKPLREVNTGSPKVLTDFLRWGKEHFPADRTALIIWNHGTGLRDLPPGFDYSALRSDDISKSQAQLKRALFETTLMKLAQAQPRLRGIAIDATARDYLDTQELQRALADASSEQPCVDLLGFDACLMCTVEIAYQLKGLTRFIVGSQETEPGEGWPYGAILHSLASMPDVSAYELARMIVTEYGAKVGRNLRGRPSPFTQAALDVSKVDETFDLAQDVANAFVDPAVLSSNLAKAALRQSRHEVKRFHDHDMADLYDLCECVRVSAKGSVNQRARETLKLLTDHLALGSGLIIANHAHGGDDASRVHGVSAYWPKSSMYMAEYDSLDFASSGWNRLAKLVTEL